MALSAMELKLGVFGVLPTRHAKTNAKPMRPRSSCTVRHFTRVLTSRSDRSRCSDITSDEPPWFWLQENPKTHIWAPIKMAQVQGSPVYIYGYTTVSCECKTYISSSCSAASWKPSSCWSWFPSSATSISYSSAAYFSQSEGSGPSYSGS